MGVTGDLFEKSCEGHFEWRIQNFPVTDEVNAEYFSRSFLFHDCSWYFEICISIDWISFAISREDCGPPRTVSCAFGIRKTDGAEEIVWKEAKRFAEIDDCFLVNNFLKKSDLLKRKSDLAPSDTLTVTCSMKSCESYSAEASLFTRLWDLSDCLWKIFRGGKKCDVVFKLKDGEIPAHTTILTKRSKVLAGMLNSDMRESETGEVEIKDADSETFDIVLGYIYSGDSRGLRPENVCKVFKLAHKYDLQELVKLSSEFMQGHLSVGMFSDVMVLAEVYKQKDLREGVKNFFVKNMSVIVKSREWKTLKENNLALVSELLESIVTENESKINI